MVETSRVAKWRQRLRDEGKAALTIWLTTDEKLRLEDLARTWHTSPSALVQQALAQFHPTQASMIASDTETSQLRLLIHEVLGAELPGMVREIAAATATVTDTSADTVTDTSSTAPVTDIVTETVAATLARDLPALVRQLVEDLALEAIGVPVPDMHGDVTDTETLGVPVPDTHSDVTDAAIREEAPAQRRTDRPRSDMRQRIVALLRGHPAGLTALEIKVHVGAKKALGDTLQGMVRQQLLTKQGRGHAVRYLALEA
jgi:hypothetical protein